MILIDPQGNLSIKFVDESCFGWKLEGGQTGELDAVGKVKLRWNLKMK